jgi:hypothetical protein
LIHDIAPAAELVARLMREATGALEGAREIIGTLSPR